MMGPDLLGRLLDRHGAALVLYARQWCDAPEDVVQEAFLKLVRQKQPPDQFVAWLYRVVRNAAISAGRSERRRKRHEGIAASRAPLFVRGTSDALDAQTAGRALEALSAEQREVIVAHLWGGLTFEEIAQVMGCSASTAHRWYAAGLAALRERLGASCPDPSTAPK